jgi:hypothetical protein
MGAAVLTGMRAWAALVSGQITLPFSLGVLKPVTRVAVPLMFHLGLVLTMLIALGFAYVAYRCWRDRSASVGMRPQENRASTLR